jgi:hypothetical protein
MLRFFFFFFVFLFIFVTSFFVCATLGLRILQLLYCVLHFLVYASLFLPLFALILCYPSLPHYFEALSLFCSFRVCGRIVALCAAMNMTRSTD